MNKQADERRRFGFGARGAKRWLSGAALLCLAVAPAPCANAQAAANAQTRLVHFQIAAQSLASALAEFGVQSQSRIIFVAADLRGLSANAVIGDFTPDAALDLLLTGAPVRAERSPDGVVRIAAPRAFPDQPGIQPIALPGGDTPPPEQSRDLASALAPASEITVVGTHIRGAAPVGANVITIGRDDIERAGYATAQQIITALPQNFATGISETTTNIAAVQGSNLNYDRGAEVNLRGLGAFSTLVLINGRRQTRSGYAALCLISP